MYTRYLEFPYNQTIAKQLQEWIFSMFCKVTPAQNVNVFFRVFLDLWPDGPVFGSGKNFGHLIPNTVFAFAHGANLTWASITRGAIPLAAFAIAVRSRPSPCIKTPRRCAQRA